MISYIKADLFRFTKKKSLKVLLAIFTLGYAGLTFLSRNNPSDIVMFNFLLLEMAPILIGVALFIIAYVDDINANSLQTPIGYGVGRTQIVIAKIIEFIILFAVVILYAFALVLLADFLLKPDFDVFTLVKPLSLIFMKTTLYASFASIFALYFQKGSLAIFAFVMLATGFVENMLSLLLNMGAVQNIVPNMATYLPLELISSLNGNGWDLTKFMILVTYGILSIVLSAVLFKKAKLEF